MKIALRYVGSDRKMKERLAKTDGLQHFEPIDAQEVLKSGNPDYEQVEDGGVIHDAHPANKVAVSTSGKPLAPVKQEKKAPSDGKTVDELKAMLKEMSVPFPSDAHRAELVELVDRNAKPE